MTYWGDLETPQEDLPTYQPLQIDRRYTRQLHYSSNLMTGNTYLEITSEQFEDLSMSTNTGPPGFDSFLLPIPNDCVGLIIGKQGDMIKQLRMTSNASVIQVAKDCAPGCAYRNVFIEGSLESYCLSKKRIYEIIDEYNRAKRLPTFNLSHALSSEPYYELIVPEMYIELILGGPELPILRQIITESNTQIMVPTKCNPGTQNRYITISGQPENINKAKMLIYDLLEPAYHQHAIANGISVIDHPDIDPAHPYCSYYAMILKTQNITLTACEDNKSATAAALKNLTLIYDSSQYVKSLKQNLRELVKQRNGNTSQHQSNAT